MRYSLIGNTQQIICRYDCPPCIREPTHLLLEPAHGFLFADAVPETNAARFLLLVSNAETGSAQDLKTKRVKERVWFRLEDM